MTFSVNEFDDNETNWKFNRKYLHQYKRFCNRHIFYKNKIKRRVSLKFFVK